MRTGWVECTNYCIETFGHCVLTLLFCYHYVTYVGHSTLLTTLPFTFDSKVINSAHNFTGQKLWADFNPQISAGERPHTQVLNRAATGIGWQTHRPIAAFIHLSNHIIETESLKRQWLLSSALHCVAHSNSLSQHCDVDENEKASLLLRILEAIYEIISTYKPRNQFWSILRLLRNKETLSHWQNLPAIH